MSLKYLVFITLLLMTFRVSGQTKTITGKIIDQNLLTVYQAHIYTSDTSLSVLTDIKGYFIATVPIATKSLVIHAVGMEPKNIELEEGCDTIEIILLYAGTYDFMTPRKVDRLRKKQFARLPELHQSAFKQSIFEKEQPCYTDRFISFREEIKKMKTSAVTPKTKQDQAQQ
ncbi:MAG: hypothetical protein QM687_00170 [Ferruginibacter sp.]